MLSVIQYVSTYKTSCRSLPLSLSLLLTAVSLSLSLDVTLIVCPGIGNSSETVALRTFSHHANEHGLRVAVLNHLGVIPDIALTQPRIFTYGRGLFPLFQHSAAPMRVGSKPSLAGSTEEYGAMVREVESMYPSSQFVAVGFSMGANLVCKYLGEDEQHRSKFLAGISCCQGYDIERSALRSSNL